MEKMKKDVPQKIRPRIIIHGGAGSIRRENLPPKSYAAYKASLLNILGRSQALLDALDATALDVAVHAVALLEDDPLFNCGKGAVFTRAGTNELEASVMVSKEYKKRGVGCTLLKHVKNPIKLAREMLIKGEKGDGGGAGMHSQLSGDELERLATEWGMEMVDQEYFFTQRRWDEHLRGLTREEQRSGTNPSLGAMAVPDMDQMTQGDQHWDGLEYLPQGTVGAVVLDRFGTICVATSTGGLTNKLPGRIGDTPTLGAGFWAEEWECQPNAQQLMVSSKLSTAADKISRGDVGGFILSCMPTFGIDFNPSSTDRVGLHKTGTRHAVGMSGTGNGDSFLRVDAARTAAAMARFSPATSLAQAVDAVAGPDGELQRSAGERFGKTGEGDGGIIGIELVGLQGSIVQNHNCGGMFRAWIDDAGKHRFMVFKEEYYLSGGGLGEC